MRLLCVCWGLNLASSACGFSTLLLFPDLRAEMDPARLLGSSEWKHLQRNRGGFSSSVSWEVNLEAVRSGEDSMESLCVGTVFIIRLIVLDICEEMRLWGDSRAETRQFTVVETLFQKGPFLCWVSLVIFHRRSLSGCDNECLWQFLLFLGYCGILLSFPNYWGVFCLFF